MSADTPRFPIYKDFVLIQLAILIFVIDQFSKFLVRDQLLHYESYPASGFFRFTHTFNTGSAFGIFRDQNTPLILVSFLGIAILIMIYRSQRVPSALLRLSLGLQIGGAVGNLVDRLRLGHVTDFVDVGDWPVFNVADASIITGLVILAWIFMVADSNGDKESDPAGGYGWCPVCDGEMRAVANGWRCNTCGVKESQVQRFSAAVPRSSGLSTPDHPRGAEPPIGNYPEEPGVYSPDDYEEKESSEEISMEEDRAL